MLRRLHIRNYLLIEELDLGLAEGLSIITGETGSGKSILMGALALALGERADAGAMRDPHKRCVIELEVDVSGKDLETWFKDHEVPHEPITILRRQLEPGGRSRAFVNDTPVRSEDMRELGARMVHIHSQHNTLLLNEPRFQLGLVDHLAGVRQLVRDYQVQYQALRRCTDELERLRNEAEQAHVRSELLVFQLNELDEAAILVDEQEELEQDLVRVDHAEELIHTLQQVEDNIQGERGALSMLAHLRQAMARAARIDSASKALLERLESVHIELKDIGAEVAAASASVLIEPARAAYLRERLDLVLRLQQKHRVSTNAELIAIWDGLRQRSNEIASLDGRIADLEGEQQGRYNEASRMAVSISRKRAKAALGLGKDVETILRGLGMPHAVFQFVHQVAPVASILDLGPHGIDSVQAIFSANKDRPAIALQKVASGGELSRVMLAMISLAADSQDLPTVVFDEVDSGVSGEVADRVGTLMSRMGQERQVIAITHLPQIASKADHHLLVTKASEGEAVHTRITVLDDLQRVEAIAQMLSGRKLTKAALENAKALLGHA